MDKISVFYADVGALIKHQRELRGFSQADLASQVGLTRTSITNIEAGRQRFPLHKLLEIATALGVRMSSLLPDSYPDQVSLAPRVVVKKPHDFDDRILGELLDAVLAETKRAASSLLDPEREQERSPDSGRTAKEGVFDGSRKDSSDD